MAFAHVRGAVGSVGGSTTFNIVLGGAPATGNLVCVGIAPGAAVTAMTVKDSANNSYTITPNSPSTNQSGAGQVWLFYLLSAPANATATITASWTTSANAAGYADEFSYTGTATFDKDVPANTGVAGTAINTPTINPTNANSLLYAVSAAGGTISAPTNGATQGVWTGVAGIITDGDMGEYVLSATGSTAVNYVQSSGTWSGMVMAFFVPAGGTIFMLGHL